MSRRNRAQQQTQVNAPYAYISAVDALLIAKSLALQSKDHSALIDIANSFVEIGNHMLTHEVALEYDEDEEESATIPTGEAVGNPVGFTGGGGYDGNTTDGD
jgi:uncharacterized protein (UPF0332 family)